MFKYRSGQGHSAYVASKASKNILSDGIRKLMDISNKYMENVMEHFEK